MVIVGLVAWWYTRGFLMELHRSGEKLASLYDYFSIDLLLKTLFLPFRQIDAGRVRGSFAVQVQAFFDNLFSRAIGFVIRTVMILIGSIALCIACIVVVVRILVWAVMPVLPVVGIVLAVSGWVPWKV